MRAAFSLLAPSRRRASYCSSSLIDDPWSFAMDCPFVADTPRVADAPKPKRLSAKREGPNGAYESRPGRDPHHVFADDAAVRGLQGRYRWAENAGAPAKGGPRQALPPETEGGNGEREQCRADAVEDRGRPRVCDGEGKLRFGALHRLPVEDAIRVTGTIPEALGPVLGALRDPRHEADEQPEHEDGPGNRDEQRVSAERLGRIFGGLLGQEVVLPGAEPTEDTEPGAQDRAGGDAGGDHEERL